MLAHPLSGPRWSSYYVPPPFNPTLKWVDHAHRGISLEHLHIADHRVQTMNQVLDRRLKVKVYIHVRRRFPASLGSIINGLSRATTLKSYDDVAKWMADTQSASIVSIGVAPDPGRQNRLITPPLSAYAPGFPWETFLGDEDIATALQTDSLSQSRSGGNSESRCSINLLRAMSGIRPRKQWMLPAASSTTQSNFQPEYCSLRFLIRMQIPR